ncbi:50S ribosomal protein L19 [Candidatus Gracilibacteria bacterium]|nr:50S ribosomal protein L19 [Candidatus Gracilibacteria bacterium]
MNYERLKTIYDKSGQSVLPIKEGMQLEIHEKIAEGDGNRVWKFRGLVIKVKKPNNADGSFTIRGPVARMTIEKIYPLSYKKFDKVLLLDEFKTRRSKLYYLRDKVGKGAKLKSAISAENKDKDLLKELKGFQKKEVSKKENKEVKAKEIKVEEVKVEENKTETNKSE